MHPSQQSKLVREDEQRDLTNRRKKARTETLTELEGVSVQKALKHYHTRIPWHIRWHLAIHNWIIRLFRRD